MGIWALWNHGYPARSKEAATLSTHVGSSPQRWPPQTQSRLETLLQLPAPEAETPGRLFAEGSDFNSYG